MKIKLCGLIVVIISGLLICSGCVNVTQEDVKYFSNENFVPNIKQGKMFFNISIRTDETVELVRLWIPYPVSNEYQEIENMFINGSYNYSGIYRESQNGNMILYAEWFIPKDFPELFLSFTVKRSERFMKNFSNNDNLLPIDVEKFLTQTSIGPIDGEVKEIAVEITKGKNTILEKAISIYDYLVDHGERDANLSFCGDGDVCALLKNLRGKCADFSSVFVTLSRSVGVPSREIFGTRISKDGDVTGSYHCYAEFYLPNYGWVPVDPSDVAKLMLKENLDLDDSKVIEARDYYFGAQTETYVDFSRGRDIILNPQQDDESLNYFMYPYAEIDGEPLNFISQENLKYVITFKEN